MQHLQKIIIVAVALLGVCVTSLVSIIWGPSAAITTWALLLILIGALMVVFYFRETQP